MQPVIEVSNLRKRYGSTLAVDDISLTVQPGEIFGILGAERRRQEHGRRNDRGAASA
jgi:ABC-type branched-subunit amino acid transport system ATPase component